MRYISMAVLAALPVIALGACSSDGPTGPTTGGLQISVAASGPDIDSDGFTITVDGSQTKTVVAGSSVSFTDLSPGDHVAAISGIADNCHSDGPASITLSVTAGQNTPGAFAVGCDAIVSGSWSYSMDLELAGVPCNITEDLSLTQAGSTFSGTASNGWIQCPLGGIDEAFPGAVVVNAATQGQAVTFDFDDSDIHHTGTVAAGTMSGSVTLQLDPTVIGTWTAVRTGGFQVIAPRAGDLDLSLKEIAARLR